MPDVANRQIKTVAIIGVGLIGGSFALAIRGRGFAGEILGVSSPSVIETAIERGAISRGVCLPKSTIRPSHLHPTYPSYSPLRWPKRLPNKMRQPFTMWLAQDY